MSIFQRHPRARWVAPAAATTLVFGGIGLAAASSSVAAPLPATTAEDLLVAIHDSAQTPVSGTVSWDANLGLPDLASAGLDAGGAELTSLLAGDSTLRVWSDGAEKSRVDLLGSSSERSFVFNGTEAWAWSSQDKTATRMVLPELPEAPTGPEAEAMEAELRAAVQECLPAGTTVEDRLGLDQMPGTPQEAASLALEQIDPTTEVTVEGQTSIAGRDSYELVLDPRDDNTKVDQIRMAIDGETGVPLRVQVFSAVTGEAEVEVGFSNVSFDQPSGDVFEFTPGEGTTVEERAFPTEDELAAAAEGNLPEGTDPAVLNDPCALLAEAEGLKEEAENATEQGDAMSDSTARIIGEGWDAIAVGTLPEGALDATMAEQIDPADLSAAMDDPEAASRIREQASETTLQLGAAIDALPSVSGEFGTARVLDGPLFSVVVVDDGRVAIGAVAPQALLDEL